MISFERALNSILGKSVEDVREFARNRILGTDIASFGSGHSTEPSEDVVIQLLGNPELETEKREAVIRGCIDIYEKIWILLGESNWIENITEWKHIFVSLCRVVDVSQPLELKRYAKLLVIRLIEEKLYFEKFYSSELFGASVRGYMAYAQQEKNIRFLEEEILTNKDVAAYGFNALLDIDPGHHCIEEHLCELWRLQREENWPVDTAFLLERAVRIRNEPDLRNRVLLKLQSKNYDL